MEKDLEKFYKQIAKALPREGRKTILPDIQSGVDSYLAENPDATIDDVIAYVGTPEEIANEYYASLDGREITKEIKVGKKVFGIILIFIVLVALIFAIVIATAFLYWQFFDHGFIEYTVETASAGDILPNAITPTDVF